MKVNPAGADYSLRRPTKNNVSKLNQVSLNALSFKSGNPRHLFHQISEMAIFGQSGGGVGTVGNDWFWFDLSDFDRVIQNIPLYNQEVQWVKELDNDNNVVGIKREGVCVRKIPAGLPDGHPFKAYEGKVFTTPLKIGKDVDLKNFLSEPKNSGKIFVLDEIGESTMEWGLEKNVPVKMYKLHKDDRVKNFLKKEKGWDDEMIKKIDVTLTYVDATASMQKPYEDGSYTYATGQNAGISYNWQGKPYPKEAKATSVMMPILKEKTGFDPLYVVCHDGQAMPLVHYAAEANARGDEYWLDKVFNVFGHNLNDGYIYPLGEKDAIIAIAKPGEIEKIVNSKEYVEALKKHTEKDFLLGLLPAEMKDARGNLNAVTMSIAYGNKGFIERFVTVSERYYKSIIENELVSPAIHKQLKELAQKSVFQGIINVLMNPLVSGFTTEGLQKYYKQDCKIQLSDGTEVFIPKFKAFDADKKYDVNEMREVKRHNKISLLKRLAIKDKKAKLWGSLANGNMGWMDSETGYSAAISGDTGRKISVMGGIDSKYLKALENGEDVITFVEWGRGDFQKGIDTGLDAWIKFVEKTGNKNSIFVFGGPLGELAKTMQARLDYCAKSDLLRGRVVGTNGWTPGDSFAFAGDYSTPASRFAPCELVDLEAMKKACVPLAPNVQGIAQKVIDPLDKERSDAANGYKCLHEYYMTEETALAAATEKEKEKFNKALIEIKKEIGADYKSKIGEDIPENYLKKQLLQNEKYNKALMELRDSVISDEIAVLIERAVNDRNTEVAEKLLKNHVDQKTQWMNNAWCNPSGKSTGQLIKEMLFSKLKGKNLRSGEELHLDLSKLTPLEERTVVNVSPMSVPKQRMPLNKYQTVRMYMDSTKGRYAIGAALLTSAAGLIYAGYKSGWLSPHYDKKETEKHVSCVG